MEQLNEAEPQKTMEQLEQLRRERMSSWTDLADQIPSVHLDSRYDGADRLYRMARRAAIKNVDQIEDVADIPWKHAALILEKIKNPDQLRKIETRCPQIAEADGELWRRFIRRDCPSVKEIPRPTNPKSWWKVYRKFHNEELQRQADAEAQLRRGLNEAQAQRGSTQIASSVVANPKLRGQREYRYDPYGSHNTLVSIRIGNKVVDLDKSKKGRPLTAIEKIRQKSAQRSATLAQQAKPIVRRPIIRLPTASNISIPVLPQGSSDANGERIPIDRSAAAAKPTIVRASQKSPYTGTMQRASAAHNRAEPLIAPVAKNTIVSPILRDATSDHTNTEADGAEGLSPRKRSPTLSPPKQLVVRKRHPPSIFAPPLKKRKP